MDIYSHLQISIKACFNKVKNGIRRFLTNTKISRIALMFLMLFLLIHYFTDHFFKLPPHGLLPETGNLYSSYRLRDLKHINELNRIKKSVSNELRELESKRNRMQLKNEQKEAAKPKMVAPARLLASEIDDVYINPPKHSKRCHMHNCFDYSRCSLTSQFPVYVYPNHNQNGEPSPFPVTSYVIEATRHAFSSIAYLTSDPNAACLYVVLIGEVESTNGLNSQPVVDGHAAALWLKALPYWRGDGRNHVLLYLTRRSTAQNPLLNVDVGRAMFAQSNFAQGQFRKGFDIVIPTLSLVGVSPNTVTSEQEVDRLNVDEWKSMDEAWSAEDIPLQVPAWRTYILSFQGQWGVTGETEFIPFKREGDLEMEKDASTSTFHDIFLESLKQMKNSKIYGTYLLETTCPEDRLVNPGYSSEWSMCGDFKSRSSYLSHSTFALLPAPERSDITSTSLFINRLAEALRSGAVPVVVGKHVELPFGEYISWEKAAILIPQARITELSFLLNNLPHADILSLRRNGRFLFDSYFSSTRQIVESVLTIMRTRLQIPALPVQDTESNVVDHPSYKVEEHEPAPGDAKSEFGFPPHESKIDSPRFKRNFTTVLMDAQESWNNAPGPFLLYPFQPNDRRLSTDAQFIGSSDGFRPIGGGEGGTGRVYQESLGGNHPREQFTMVMLTYEREDVLLQAIERLKDLPHLNKVLVVWNSPTTPSTTLRWPDIGVEVVVVQAEQNSLNNRFVPWDEIETEAVLSIDDDAHLRHDEILFGFRVWRENRDRVVGFPGRFHSWDQRGSSWNYNSNHTCELSMVLTGAAFIHKYYMYLYTYWMSSIVRETVDEFMNCEDIAMNFLVSHLTRSPPVKVTSRWTFRCPGCPMALSQSDEHFQERHKCINRFVKIFGYMPLVYTQYRVDSILFKTRLPHDKQKCFKFI